MPVSTISPETDYGNRIFLSRLSGEKVIADLDSTFSVYSPVKERNPVVVMPEVLNPRMDIAEKIETIHHLKRESMKLRHPCPRRLLGGAQDIKPVGMRLNYRTYDLESFIGLLFCLDGRKICNQPDKLYNF